MFSWWATTDSGTREAVIMLGCVIGAFVAVFVVLPLISKLRE